MTKLPIDLKDLLGWASVLVGLFGVLLFVLHTENILQRPAKLNFNLFRKKANPEYAVSLLNRLFRLMNEEKPYLNKDISLENLATLLNVSAERLAQVINENLEQSFIELISTYRIQEAKRLLVTPEYRHSKMDELARKVGYESMTHFNEAFKKHTEQTPTEYKKRMNMICL